MGQVLVPFGDNQRDTATLLLAAVEESKDHEPGSVTVDHFEGGFRAPVEIAKAAGLDYSDPEADREAELEEARKNSGTLRSESVTEEAAEVKQQEALRKESPLPEQPTAKKAAAKKAPAKKSAAKKSTAKKSTAKKASK